jgi:tetratricopeptide (TPR) repeat protein
MSSTRARSVSQQSPQGDAPTQRRPVIIGMTAILIAILGWTGWIWYSAHRVRDLRQAVQRGRSYLRQGRPELAFQAVSDVRDDEPGADQAVKLAAQALIRMGELRVARLALERSLKLNPDQFEAIVTLAELNVDLGNGQRGADLFVAAARLRPREPRVWLALANVLQDLSDPQRAVTAYEKVLELNPDQREAMIGVIRGWLLGNAPDRAEPWVTKAIQRYPKDPIILGLGARQAFAQGQMDETIARAGLALARDPQNADALLARARASGARSNWEQALHDAEKAVAAVPSDLDALQFLLMVETRMGLTERAAASLRRRSLALEQTQKMERLMREIEELPDDAELRTRLGQAALEAGATLLAGRCFEAALALDPNHQPARERLTALRKNQPQGLPAARPTQPKDSTSERGAEPSRK